MNKYLFLICFFGFSIFHLTANAQKITTSSDVHLKGKVWKIDTYRHIADSVQIIDNKVSYKKTRLLNHVQHFFSRDGLMQAENRFKVDEDLIEWSVIYTFDEQNRLVDVTSATFGEYLAGMVLYQYDKEGRVSKGLVYDHRDSLQNTISYTYNASGKLIREATYNRTPTKIKELVYQYDENGNCISTRNIKTSARSNTPYREVQKFDERNNLIYKSFYNENDSLEWEYFANYDSHDSLFYEEVKEKDGTTSHRSDLTYNKKNHTRKSLMLYANQNGETHQIYSRYKYDKQQRLLWEEKFSPKKRKPFLTRQYFYDNHNNWIYCVEKYTETGRTIVNSRQIVYY